MLQTFFEKLSRKTRLPQEIAEQQQVEADLWVPLQFIDLSPDIYLEKAILCTQLGPHMQTQDQYRYPKTVD